MNDEIKDSEGFYIAKGEPDKVSALVDIPLPPAHVMRSAFLTAIKYRSVDTALRAYNSCIRELSSIKSSQSALMTAQLEEQRMIELLKDASSVHAVDSAKRKLNLLQAEDALEQAEHEIYLAKKKREVEKHNADLQHAQLMKVELEEKTDTLDQLSEEDKETKAWMEAQIFRHRREKAMADELRAKGNLTKEEDENLTALLEKLATNPAG